MMIAPEPKHCRDRLVRHQQRDLVSEHTGAGDYCQQARPPFVVPQVCEEGKRVAAQTSERQHPEQRERDQINGQQNHRDGAQAERGGCDRNNPGGHEKRKASAGKLGNEPKRPLPACPGRGLSSIRVPTER